MDALAEAGKNFLSSIKDMAEDDVREFIDDNQEIRDLLEERGKRLAEIGKEYITADPDRRTTLLDSAETVKDTMELAIARAAVNLKAESQAKLKKYANAAFGAIVKFLPSLL